MDNFLPIVPHEPGCNFRSRNHKLSSFLRIVTFTIHDAMDICISYKLPFLRNLGRKILPISMKPSHQTHNEAHSNSIEDANSVTLD
jgi:hypothetical protein